MSKQIQIEADLYSDWIAILKNRLESYGIEVGKDKNAQDISLMFFNFLKRIVEPKPRKVKISKEFSCPKKYTKELSKIIKMIERGDSIIPFLSRFTFHVNSEEQYKKYDGLLNDWGIHHLHFQTEGTKELIFAKFDEDTAYFIQVKKHGDWADYELLEIVQNNWPSIIVGYELKNVLAAKPRLTAKEHKMLRNKGISVISTLSNGKVYAPPGGGTTTSGISIKTVTTSDYHRKVLVSFEKYIRENFKKLLKKSTLDSIKDGKLKLKLSIMNERPTAHNDDYSISFQLAPDGYVSAVAMKKKKDTKKV